MTSGQRVIVGVTGSVGNLQALRRAMAEARSHHATLLAVHAWVPPGGDGAERRSAVPELRQVWEDAGWQQLWAAFDAALGGVPRDVPVEPLVVRGNPGQVLVATADREDDLLVVGAGRRGVLHRVRHKVSRYCAAHAQCPVMIVPPSRLAQEMEHPLHAWLVRRRALLPGRDELSDRPG